MELMLRIKMQMNAPDESEQAVPRRSHGDQSERQENEIPRTWRRCARCCASAHHSAVLSTVRMMKRGMMVEVAYEPGLSSRENRPGAVRSGSGTHVRQNQNPCR